MTELESNIGNAVDFHTENIETSVCVFYPNDKRFSSHDKDSILSIYKKNKHEKLHYTINRLDNNKLFKQK